MATFKLIVDILASVASIIAILSLLYSWHKNRQPVLKIKKVVIHSFPDGSNNYLLILNNRKNYTVSISAIECYKRKEFRVEKINNQKATYSETYNLADRVFKGENIEICPNAETNIKISGNAIDSGITKLSFLLQTSHGSHEIKCEKITRVAMGVTDCYGMEHNETFYSKPEALFAYRSVLSTSKD